MSKRIRLSKSIHLQERADGQRTVHLESHNHDSIGDPVVTTALTRAQIAAALKGYVDRVERTDANMTTVAGGRRQPTRRARIAEIKRSVKAAEQQ